MDFQYDMKYRWIVGVVGILLGSVMASGLSNAAEKATVLVSDLNVRSGPNLAHDVLFRLPSQSQVRVLEHSAGWLKIEHDGRSGYILDRRHLVRVDPGKAENSVDVTAALKPLKDLRREADQLQEKVKTRQDQLAAISRKEQSVLDGINAAEKALDHARRQVRQARAEVAALQEKAAEIDRRQAFLQEEIRDGEAYTAQRLVALYKLNWVGRVHLLATAHSFYDFIDRRAALERILNQDEALLEKMRDDQAELAALIAQLNTSRAEKHASELALQQRMDALHSEQAKRTAMLAKLRSEKSMGNAALHSLRQAAGQLDATIAAIESAPPPKPKTAAARVSEKKPPLENGTVFSGLPVKGKIISFFGPYRDEKTNLVNFQSGINIQAERGEPIRAVAGGQAVYATWFKGYGNMMIIDHGNHFYTVYAHLEEVFKVKGDRVEKDEVIATVGDSGSLLGPALHFEVRHRGEPVDPLKWISKG
ncbi:MAG: hypothetical protein VR64_17230 [Desulfatitalea sp. BRH_c12]|nr:MAG: hypothetical protein VR64_17230 [Desulfatitalea sp. BRH_c12]